MNASHNTLTLAFANISVDAADILTKGVGKGASTELSHSRIRAPANK